MKPYSLHVGKSELVLKEYPDNYFDSCVTDSPYGIRFMGKAWDSFDIRDKSGYRRNGAHQNIAIEAGKYDLSPKAMVEFQNWFRGISIEIFRVLKPGAHFLNFSSPRTYHRMACAVEEAGFEIRDQIMWLFASGFPKSHNLEGDFNGWGTALKPAHEPIVVARKPFTSTVLKNMQDHGTGALNIDACRISGEPWFYGNQPKLNGARYQPGQITPTERHAENITGGENGRWPANIIHDGQVEFPEAKGQQGRVGPEHGERKSVNTYGDYGARTNCEPREESITSAARFFYCAKTSRSDRNEGLDHLVEKPLLWSSGEKNPGSFQSEHTNKASQNNHPTVKPTDLMRYLICLVTPKGGLVLDPFLGSGSTGKAAMLEHMNFVGIDMDEKWIEISKHRIEFGLTNRNNQIKLDL